MLWPSATNVPDMTDIPAMPGTRTLSSSWSPWKSRPKKARKSSGRPRLKNAALGLRQNRRRSRRYWCHSSATSDMTGLRLLDVGGELGLDVLQRGSADLQVLELLAAGQRVGGQAREQARGIVGHMLDLLAQRVAVGHAHAGAMADPELAWRAFGEDRAA